MSGLPGYACLFLLATLATARLTRLVNADTITATLRASWLTRFGARTTAGGFITCPWCVGFWAALLVTGTGVWAYTTNALAWWAIPATVLAISWLVGVLAGLDR